MGSALGWLAALTRAAPRCGPTASPSRPSAPALPSMAVAAPGMAATVPSMARGGVRHGCGDAQPVPPEGHRLLDGSCSCLMHPVASTWPACARRGTAPLVGGWQQQSIVSPPGPARASIQS